MSKHEQIDYSVGIIGAGFVGGAMHSLFPKALVYDKYPNPYFRITGEAFDQDIIFICVPTDQLEGGSCDLSNVRECVEKCSPDSTVVIKSTIPPKGVDEIESIRAGCVYNPEFLTERNWKEDIRNETRVLLGSYFTENSVKVARLYQKVYGQNVSYQYDDPKNVVMAKYATNAFLATKVAFANQMHDICQEQGLSWDIIRELFILDKRVGPTHTLVTERRGFGGYCLPKDLSALIAMSEEAPLLKSVQDYNKQIRGE